MRRLARSMGPTLLALVALRPVFPEDAERVADLRLVHLLDGSRDVAPDSDLSRVGETEVGKLASAAKVDLLRTKNPLLAATYEDGRLFYVFYKTTAGAFGDRPYLFQRIRKTERTWKDEKDRSPDEKVTYQVEAFKLSAGALKRPDQHHGSFAIRDAHRREVVKEYEIGFGEIPGVAEGRTWPFDPGTLFRMIQPYQDEPALHESVRFSRALTWTLTVSFERGGTWRVASPELGFDAPKRWPDASAAEPARDSSSKPVVLEPGVGLSGVRIGESTAEDLEKALGAPLEDVEVGRGHRLLSFRRSLTCNLDPKGVLNTVITRPGFEGSTREGVAHGQPRARVMERMGAPKGQPADAPHWSYPGMVVWFDAFDRVVRLVVVRR
jgi:hypothetical protein